MENKQVFYDAMLNRPRKGLRSWFTELSQTTGFLTSFDRTQVI